MFLTDTVNSSKCRTQCNASELMQETKCAKCKKKTLQILSHFDLAAKRGRLSMAHIEPNIICCA